MTIPLSSGPTVGPQREVKFRKATPSLAPGTHTATALPDCALTFMPLDTTTYKLPCQQLSGLMGSR